MSTRSETLFEAAKQVIPGGVNSPVRAFAAVGGNPPFIRRADGPYLYDEDGNRYLDFVLSWGPMILGHNRQEVREAVVAACQNGLSFGAATEAEVQMARFVCDNVPFVELVRMVNSGTEAVMSAIRVARGFTGREKIIKFDGCYHGHSDSLLVKAGSGLLTTGIPGSAGVTAGCAKDTLTAAYNDLPAVRTLLERNEVACIVVEPVAANMGVVAPKPDFLPGLRTLCDEFGALLIFDEVITGFRLGLTGAAGFYGVTPDLVTYGKIIGAGMPVGAYGGRRDVMERVSPLGPVYQAGTLSGNPVAMAAGLAQLTILRDHPEIYTNLKETGDWFFEELEGICREAGLSYTVNHVGSLGSLFFTNTRVFSEQDAKTADLQAFARYARFLLAHGVYCAPSQFEAMFLSAAHEKTQLEQTLSLARDYFGKGNG